MAPSCVNISTKCTSISQTTVENVSTFFFIISQLNYSQIDTDILENIEYFDNLFKDTNFYII